MKAANEIAKELKRKKNYIGEFLVEIRLAQSDWLHIEGDHSIFLLPTLVDLDIVWFDFSFGWLYEYTYIGILYSCS